MREVRRPQERKDMMQEEYERMVGHDVDFERYAEIEWVYVHCPMFNCPDDVRQFVKRKGGEEMIEAMADMARVAIKAEGEAEAANGYINDVMDGQLKEARARVEADERIIAELVRKADAATISAQERKAEADRLRTKLKDLQDALCDLVFPEAA